MKNLLKINLPDTSLNSVLTADDTNAITLLITPLNSQLTGYVITGTLADGSSVTSGEIQPVNGEIQFTLPFAWYSAEGSFTLRLESNEGNSDYFTFDVTSDLTADDDIKIRIISGVFTVSVHTDVRGYALLLSATDTGTKTIDGNISDFDWIMLEGYFSTTNINESRLIPRSIFELGHKYYLWSNFDSTVREVSVKYASDTSVTIADRSALNVRVYGIN